jgi:hypothetical protein
MAVMKRISLLCLLLALAVEGICRGDLQVQTYQPNRQDRFYAGSDKDFVGQAFDWSGVGQVVTTDPTQRSWATMISDQYFLSAFHFFPSDNAQLIFYQGNDYSNPYVATVASMATIYHITSYNGVLSDLWLGKLTAPIPADAHIAYYPVLDLPSYDDYAGQMIYVNGKQNRVGRNVIDHVVATYETDDKDVIIKKTVVMEYDFNTVSGLGADECYLQDLDSGGPSFVDVDGQLALVGIHYYNGGTPGPEETGPVSGDSFVPYYIDQLNSHMGGERVSVVVPEPASLALLSVFVAVVVPLGRFVRRRKLA